MNEILHEFFFEHISQQGSKELKQNNQRLSPQPSPSRLEKRILSWEMRWIMTLN